MVLLFSVERCKQHSGDGKGGGSAYIWSTFEDRVAVIYDGEKDSCPAPSEIESELQVMRYATPPSFFVTPFDGVVKDGSDGVEGTALQRVFEGIAQSMQRRENVTIVHRGANAEAHLEPFLINFLAAVRPSAEYGMQVVADETAKDKQMQRLLKMSLNVPSDETMNNGDSAANEVDAGPENEESVRLSRGLRKRIQKLRQEYHYVHPADRRTDAACRYGLLSAAHDELLQPPHNDAAALVPHAFVACPPIPRASRPSRTAASTAVKNTRSHTALFNQMQRRNTAMLLTDLKQTGGGSSYEPIAGNGWGHEITTYAFDGTSSVMALPGIPNFDELIRAFTVDMWVRTDLKAADGKRVLLQVMEGQREDLGQLFQLSLNWYEDMPDSVRVIIRDSANRVLEAVASVARTGLTDGDLFHHLLVRVDNLEEGQLTCKVDGKAVDVQLMQQEHPNAFNPWPHRLFVGGYLDETNTAALVFRGTVMELRVWSGGDAARPIVRWPLLACDGKALPEATRTVPADHQETLVNLHAVEEVPPCSAPSFDGSLVMNMGTLPLFGQLMHNWRMEFRFRTDVLTRMMTLVGVTDSSFKMQEFGIVLNAEPVLSKERFRYHELHTTFYMVDAFGVCCSAVLRGTEHHNLMDGEWHTLVWRCIDSEANKFTVKVDDVLQDLLFVSREGPTRFVQNENWIAVGGHNVRNWKILRPFCGEVGRFYLSLRGRPYVTLPMSEGPGAYVLQDRSGHNNHGLLIHTATNVVRRHDVMWVPAPPGEDSDRLTNARADVRIFKNNDVAIAAVVFTCDFAQGGVPVETIYDIFTKQHHQLTATPHLLAGASEAQWKSWYGLPAECFHDLDTVTRLEESINAVLGAEAPRGHLMVAVCVGDCRASMLHLREPELPDGAVYDCNMLKWHYPYMVEGQHGRRELMLKRMVEGAEAVLLSDTLKPYVTARLGPLNAGTRTVRTDAIIRSLQDGGRPWFLPVVLHAHLLNAEFGSELHIVHRVHPRMSQDQAAAVCLFNKRLFDGVRENASLVIQRNWRGHMATRDAARRSRERSADDRRVEEIRALRMNPAAKAKSQLAALLITLHHPRCDGVLPIDGDVQPLVEALRLQGYEVATLEDPDAPTMMRVIAQLDTSRLNFVYVNGYGGAMNVRQPPIFGLVSLGLYVEEQAARMRLECEASATYRQLVAHRREEVARVPGKNKASGKGGKAAAAAGGRPKRQTEEEMELERRQQEAALRSRRQQMEQQEAFARDGVVQEYDEMCRLLSRELRQAVAATREYVARYRAKGPEGDAANFVYPCESRMIEPYASTVVDVEDVVRIALHRQAPPPGLQCIVALDLRPLTPFSCGMACLASSTGNTFRIPYRPMQRELLSRVLVKAFNGHLPKVSASSKYAVLSGGIETADHQRDWKSFATYVVTKLQPSCEPERFRVLRGELDRHVPFVADLIPVRDVALDVEARDRRRRERDAQKVKAVATFGVGSAKVESDMFTLFRGLLDGTTLSDLSFTNTIRLLFTRHNAGIDGIATADVTAELEKCRPNDCGVALRVAVTAGGVQVKFDVREPGERPHVLQWLNAIVLRSLTWRIYQRPLLGTAPLEIDYVEYLYDVRVSCSLRRYRQLSKQLDANPIPKSYICALGTRLLKS